MSGIQTWSRGKCYPATVVSVGGFPADDNDNTAEVWYRGVKIKNFSNYKLAECVANHLGWMESEYGVERALKWAKWQTSVHWSDIK
jgi:hypothetical protein